METKDKGTVRSRIFYIVIVLVMLISATGYFIYTGTRHTGSVAVVRIGERELLRAELSEDARFLLEDGVVTRVPNDYRMAEHYSIEELGKHHINILEVKDGRISCIEANCPDLTCVHIAPMGEGTDGIPIACLPHGMIITVE